MLLHQNFRDCQEWKKQGLPLSTTSNEACKMFDAALSQLVAFCNEPSVDGMEGALKRLNEADPDFVMGHVFNNGMKYSGMMCNPKHNKEYSAQIDHMVKLAESQAKTLTEREKQHVKAVKVMSEGNMSASTEIWNDILVEYPTDWLALRFSHSTYFTLGEIVKMRDMFGRSMPYLTSNVPLYEYANGYYAFGLEETNIYDQAEKYAKKGMELNRHDGWAHHALGHVYEMTGRPKEGVKLYSTKENEWQKADFLGCHNYWHYSVFHTEMGDYESALGLFDSEIIKRASNGLAIVSLADASSILCRLQYEGVDVGDRWSEVYDICRGHLDDHLMLFGDAHILMALLGAEKKEDTKQFMESTKQFLLSGEGDNHRVMKAIGLPVLEALVAYDEEDFGKAVELLLPHRYNLMPMGGSNAQRDVFNLFLINAAIKSPLKKHHKLARSLILERQAQKEDSPLSERLMAKTLALHSS